MPDESPPGPAVTFSRRRHEDEAAWAALIAALPPAEAAVLAKAGGLLQRRAVVCEQAGRVLGLAFGYRRPLTAYLKLALLWASQDPALAPALLRAFERLAAEEGACVVKLEQPAAFPLSGEALLRAGYRPLPAPAGVALAGVALAGRPLGWAKPLLNSWPAAAPPYYGQTTGMTCGPCALGMALAHQGAAPSPRRQDEIALWREATTIYAPAGPGGCDPFGLAVAALKRGLRATVYLSTPDPVLLNRASSDDRREVMRFVQEEFRREAVELGATVHWRAFALEEIGAALDEGALAILLIDEDHMHVEGAPHWVLAHGRSGDAWLVNDPWIDAHLGETWVDASHLPIPERHLDRMCWYGDPAYRAAVVLRPRLL